MMAKAGKGARHGGRPKHANQAEWNRALALDKYALAPGETLADRRARKVDGPRQYRARLRLNMKDGGVRYVGLLLTEPERERVARYSDDELLVMITDEKAARVRRQSTMEMLAQVPAGYVTVDAGPEWVDGGRRVPTVAEFMDKTRPQPTPEMARKLPAPWNTTISEALEVKYRLAQWAGSIPGRQVFDSMARSVGPGANPDGSSEGRAKMMRTFFQATCMEAPLYVCTRKTTRELMQAASVLEDWTPEDDLMPHENGAFIMFEEAIQFHITGNEVLERNIFELRGLVMTRIYFGTDQAVVEDPTTTVAIEQAQHPRQFSARVKNWTERIHVSGLLTTAGSSDLPMLRDVVGWNVGLPLSKHRTQWDGYAEGGATVWDKTDEMESKLLGAFLLWIKQRIMVYSERQADRAARRRIAAMPHKPNPEAPIMLVELRAKDYITTPDKEDKVAVEWHYRWVVRGHWRHNQRCGVGNKERRPVYIEPYLKGPPDMPLKPPRAVVFAVTR